jgi:RNA polymerase sigma-70 factor, ECF subfamily
MLSFSKKDRQNEFLDLMHSNQGIVIKICRIYTQTKDDFEDLYQEILVQGWQSYPRFKGNAKFSTWLYKVSINTALTYKKRETPHKKDIDFKEENLFQYGIQINGYENQDLLDSVLSSLNNGDKAFLILHLDGYSYEEIAEMMGISVSNTGVKINRIKNKLKGLLINE